jgi:formate dehydrogenase subunit gamma
VRFTRGERVLHWANAALFGVLMATAAVLYVGPLSTIVGRRELMRTIHVYAGLALPLPLLVAAARSPAFRADARRLNRWMTDDRRWFRTLGHDPRIRLGKFHPGQKLNAAFIAGAVPVMLGSGAIMRWFHPFPLAWRTGATFVHDWTALGIFVLVAGHIVKALSSPEAMRGMLTGRVNGPWAAHHHPRWMEELTLPTGASPGPSPPAPPPSASRTGPSSR